MSTWLDPEATQAIIAARSTFDAAENAALAESERIVGAYHDVMVVTPAQYRAQRAGPVQPIARSPAWRREQQRRALYAYSVTKPKIDAARQALARSTLQALRTFFTREVAAGRISPTDYRRYTREIRAGYLPEFRGRKWTGPAVYEFPGATVSPEYTAVLQEVRKLWLAQGQRQSALIWTPATREFYRNLVPSAHADR